MTNLSLKVRPSRFWRVSKQHNCDSGILTFRPIEAKRYQLLRVWAVIGPRRDQTTLHYYLGDVPSAGPVKLGQRT